MKLKAILYAVAIVSAILTLIIEYERGIHGIKTLERDPAWITAGITWICIIYLSILRHNESNNKNQ